MATLATEGNRVSNVIKWMAFPSEGYHTEVITLNLAAGATLVCGTVLAKVTATGKYVVQDAGAGAGAGLEASAVLIGLDELGGDVVCATTTDKKALVIKRGPAKVAKQKLVMGAGTDQAAEKNAVYAALEALGILAVEQL